VPANMQFAPFLPGFALRVECDVTPTKQTTDEFLPGARTDIKDSLAQHVFARKTDALTVLDRARCAQFASRTLPRDAHAASRTVQRDAGDKRR
jgi:hypothetical protein